MSATTAGFPVAVMGPGGAHHGLDPPSVSLPAGPAPRGNVGELNAGGTGERELAFSRVLRGAGFGRKILV